MCLRKIYKENCALYFMVILFFFLMYKLMMDLYVAFFFFIKKTHFKWKALKSSFRHLIIKWMEELRTLFELSLTGLTIDSHKNSRIYLTNPNFSSSVQLNKAYYTYVVSHITIRFQSRPHSELYMSSIHLYTINNSFQILCFFPSSIRRSRLFFRLTHNMGHIITCQISIGDN